MSGVSRPRALFVGLSCQDHVWRVGRFPPTGSRTDATAYRSQGGGPAATAAVAAARLGVEAALVALHGDDGAADGLLAELRAYGVDTAAVARIPGATSFVSAVLVGPSGERWIFPYRGSGLDDDERWLGTTDPADFAAVLVDLRHPRLCVAAAEAARAAGVPVVADYGNLRGFEHAGLADHLLVSQECAAELLGRDDPEAALARLRQRPDQVVGVTLGPEGVVAEHRGTLVRLPGFAVDEVDTTGAGDVFHGAYTVAVARGWELASALAFASAAAALKCTRFGSRAGIPDEDQVRALLRERAPELEPPA